MRKLLLLLCSILWVFNQPVFAQTYTDQEAWSDWNQLKKKPLTERNFRAACDLMQKIGKTNLSISYEMLSQYVPIVKATGNRRWIHILLMGWAKAKEAFGFFDEAQQLYTQARDNARFDSRTYNESLVGTVLMYLEWGKMDSLEKYLAIGQKVCKETGDNENLSFIYTFRAMSQPQDTAAMRQCLDTAIRLAGGLADKNALFTASYNHAVIYSQFSLARQAAELEELYELSKDSTLDRYPVKLYDRTAFTFRNAGPSVYYNLMQVNFLLTDYDNAWKFAELFYNATIKPNPASINAPYFNADMAIAKAYQNDYANAAGYLNESRRQFSMPDDSITYISYFIASGMMAEQAHQNEKALHYYAMALRRGNSQSQHMVPPEIYYANALLTANKLEEASEELGKLKESVQTRKYSAIGLNYYKCYAALLKAKGDFGNYSKAFEIFTNIKDSLTNLNRYRVIKEVETRMRVHDKEQQIDRLHYENEAKQKEIRKERIYRIIFSTLAAVIILLLLAYSRNLIQRRRQSEKIARQNEILQQNKIEEMEKQHRIEVMQGAIDAEENERYKIADQLHDETGGMLSLASLNISSVLEKAGQDDLSHEKLGKAYEILTSVSASIRDISHRLTPLVIEKYGFRKAIEDIDYSINLSGKIKFHTVIIGFEDAAKYPVGLLNNIYRIVQELVHNIVKHSQATDAMLEVVEHEDNISIIAEDNGIGIDDYQAAKGKGLEGIRSKIAYLKGRMEITRKNDKGTLIVIEIPV
ncbi:MAG: ATP-binding protein [Chitinophagaceae bacterium]